MFCLWVVGLAVSHINESNYKLMSPEYFFNDKSAIQLHPWTRWNKNFASRRQNGAQKMQDERVTKSLLYSNCPRILFNLALWLRSSILTLTDIYRPMTSLEQVWHSVPSKLMYNCVCHTHKWLAGMWDTITCLRQSGIPKDHENEFFTKDIYSQICQKCFAIKV